MSRARILVADDDQWIVRMVTTVLEKRGHDVIGAADGEEAFAQATAQPPDLIVTDVMMPKLDGWGLIKRLRSTPELAFVPVIFLTALAGDEDRIRGFRLGADDYLPKPFRFDELELRVVRALAHREQRERPALDAPTDRGPGLRGKLEQFGLSSLLLILEMERKTGLLVLGRDGLMAGDAPETARVHVRNGRVVRARIDQRAQPVNAAAIYELLSWSGGGFEFSADNVDLEDEVGASTTQLLLEGARQIDEAGARR